MTTALYIWVAVFLLSGVPVYMTVRRLGRRLGPDPSTGAIVGLFLKIGAVVVLNVLFLMVLGYVLIIAT